MTEEQKAAAIQAKANGIYFPEKYRKSLQGAALLGVHEFRAKHPNGELHQAIAYIISTANPKMPPLYLLEFTQHIINTWTALAVRQAEAIAA